MRVNATIEEINNQFNLQIHREIKQQERTGSDFKKVYSSIMKDIFNLTIDFDLNDWRKVRTEQFWYEYDNARNDYDRKFLVLQYIKMYILKFKDK
jgi:hypothetical protein